MSCYGRAKLARQSTEHGWVSEVDYEAFDCLTGTPS